ncbi:MAG TPA: amino acid permease [Steroidobacteraceae bacterium]|nr:amino acid permease [Steroidobacteraceae bacterium]
MSTSTTERDAGLIRGLGTWGLAASIVSMIVGAGIFAVPSALAAAVGPYAPLAFLACGVAIGAVAICFAEGGSRIPTSGGAYGYIEASLGPLPGYVCGTLLWISNALASGGVAAAFADIVASVTAPSLRAYVRPAAMVVLVGIIALVNVLGVRRGAQLIGAATVMKLVPLIVFVLVGALAIRSAPLTLQPGSISGDVGRAFMLAMFALIGMESSLCASGEVVEPARTIPRAIALALITVIVLYLGIQIVAQGILGAALAASTSPLADAMGRVSPGLRVLMLAGAGLSMFGFMGSDVLSTPRMLFAFGRDGWLPRALGRVHPHTGAPHIAIVSYAVLVILLAATGTFAELAVLAVLTMAPLYILGCLAAWRLARDGVARAGTPLNFRWPGVAAVIGIGSMLAMAALASRAEILGLAALIGISIAVYLLQTRLAPSAASRPS